jgi:hypothetical protein
MTNRSGSLVTRRVAAAAVKRAPIAAVYAAGVALGLKVAAPALASVPAMATATLAAMSAAAGLGLAILPTPRIAAGIIKRIPIACASALGVAFAVRVAGPALFHGPPMATHVARAVSIGVGMGIAAITPSPFLPPSRTRTPELVEPSDLDK